MQPCKKICHLRSCSIGINRFNRERLRLTRLTFSTLPQPFLVETRSFLGIVITRPPCNGVNMAGACHARAVVSFVLSEVLEDDAAKNESDDELEGLAALFLEHEQKHAVRIRGYVEEVVANLSDDRFKRNFPLIFV